MCYTLLLLELNILQCCEHDIVKAGFGAMLIAIAISVAVSYAISQLMMKPPKVKGVSASTAELPTIEEGSHYDILFGTCMIKNPKIAWWGDIGAHAIRRHVTYNKWFNNKRKYYTVGYHYSMGIHFLLVQGIIDGIKQLRVEDKVIWPNPSDDKVLAADGQTLISIDLINLFGGEDREGGMRGTIDIQYGSSTQTANAYLALQHPGVTMAASRGLLGVIFRGIFGTAPYPKQWSFICKRTDKLTDGSVQWYKDTANINDCLNAAHILRECLTNSQWGLGHPSAAIDDDTWEYAADKLYEENFGLSCVWPADVSVEDFIRDILRYVSGVIYQEMTTGKFVLKLARDDYDVEELEEFGPESIQAVEDFSRESIGEIPNKIIVNYTNLIGDCPISITDSDLGMIEAQAGKIIPLELNFPAITNDDLAAKVAARERAQISSMLITLTIKTKRSMAHLRPCDVFKLNWPILGISNLVLRVVQVNYGTLEDGTVTYICVEDVFAAGTAIYANPPESLWEKPGTDPVESPSRLLIEIPFWDILADSGLSIALLLDKDAAFLGISALKPSGDSFDYELLVRDTPTSEFLSVGRGDFTPTGLLDSGIPLNAVDVELDLNDPIDLINVAEDSYAIIGNEVVKILSVDVANDKVTVARGVLDTVPEAHLADSRIWFFDSVSYMHGQEYTAGDTPGTKILPATSLGQLDAGSAPIDEASPFNSRQYRPYPPGDFKINDVSYPSSFSGQPTLTWAHRDRTQQIGYIVEHSESSIGDREGDTVTYTLKIYDEDNILVRTEPDLTGTSYTYSEANERADCGLGPEDPLNTQLRFVLYSVRDSYDSWQSYDLTVLRS